MDYCGKKKLEIFVVVTGIQSFTFYLIYYFERTKTLEIFFIF